ncbi:MAG: nucleoside triphosphate pyrophosphohydrolase [Bdellovibrionota bacterium]
MVKPPADLEKFDSFVEIVAALRGPDGCPWDKEQTHRTLTPYAIEEAHELAEAIEAGTTPDVVGELGDLLLQVILHAEIGRQEKDPAKNFDIHDVVRAISEKMVRRHPHVFGDTKVSDSNEVLDNWSKLKAEEKIRAGKEKTEDPVRFDVPVSLPALQRAHKIGDKTQRLRFDWSSPGEVMKKVDEEVAELHEEMKDETDKAALEHEIGDVLFSVAQLARHLGLEAEQCLRTANSRFETRFFAMKKAIAASGRNYDSLKPEELEAEWQKVKLTFAKGTK